VKLSQELLDRLHRAAWAVSYGEDLAAIHSAGFIALGCSAQGERAAAWNHALS
jgi:hypothetical protein